MGVQYGADPGRQLPPPAGPPPATAESEFQLLGASPRSAPVPAEWSATVLHPGRLPAASMQRLGPRQTGSQALNPEPTQHLNRAYAAASTASATGPGRAAADRRIAAPPTGADRQPSSAASSAVSTACDQPPNPQ